MIYLFITIIVALVFVRFLLILNLQEKHPKIYEDLGQPSLVGNIFFFQQDLLGKYREEISSSTLLLSKIATALLVGQAIVFIFLIAGS